MFNMKKVMWCVVKVIAASPQAAHYSWRSSVLTRAQSFFRAMYSWQDLDFCICLSALLHPYMSSKVTQVRMFHYQKVKHWVSKAASKFFLDLDRKFTVRTIHHVFTFSWKYSSRSWRFQWPVSRKAVLFHEFISAVNSTNYSSYRVELDNHPDNVLVQGDNMYLNAFNRMISFLVRDFCRWTTYQRNRCLL